MGKNCENKVTQGSQFLKGTREQGPPWETLTNGMPLVVLRGRIIIHEKAKDLLVKNFNNLNF